jgi:hypothetical protein
MRLAFEVLLIVLVGAVVALAGGYAMRFLLPPAEIRTLA